MASNIVQNKLLINRTPAFSILLVICILLATACNAVPVVTVESTLRPTLTQTAPVAVLATTAPGISAPQPTETVMPTQVTQTLTPADQVMDYPAYGFRLTVPELLKVFPQPAEGNLRLFLGFAWGSALNPDYPMPPIGLRVFEKSATSNLVDWFGQNQGGCYERGTTPPPDHYFIDPYVDNQEPFKGFPALHYESGCWPIAEEQVIDHGRWVIALFYLKDYPQDYQKGYQQILTSLEFFEPTPQLTGSETPLPLTATPPPCLDEAAKPEEVHPRQTPLEVHFTSDGNLWAWVEGKAEAQQISDTGDAHWFSFAPDGQVIAFTRGEQFAQTELWSIRRDGSGLRLLLSADQLHQMVGVPKHPEFGYYDNVEMIQWLAGSHTLGFEVVRNYNAIGGCCETGGYWQVNTDTGELAHWTPPAAIANPPEGLVSPDGRQIALKGDTSLTLINADGTNRRENVLIYPSVSFGGEGASRGQGAQVFWADDSQSLGAITFTEDLFSDQATFTTWRVPVDGSPAVKLATFIGLPWSVVWTAAVSPTFAYIAYLRMNVPTSNDLTLHLATFDGAHDIAYARGEMMRFWGWAPDGFHFLFGQATTNALQWGSLCGGSQSLLDPPVFPVRDIEWVDASHFLFVAGAYGDPNAELRLGEIGGTSILIGKHLGTSSYYQFVPDDAALGK